MEWCKIVGWYFPVCYRWQLLSMSWWAR